MDDFGDDVHMTSGTRHTNLRNVIKLADYSDRITRFYYYKMIDDSFLTGLFAMLLRDAVERRTDAIALQPYSDGLTEPGLDLLVVTGIVGCDREPSCEQPLGVGRVQGVAQVGLGVDRLAARRVGLADLRHVVVERGELGLQVVVRRTEPLAEEPLLGPDGSPEDEEHGDRDSTSPQNVGPSSATAR